LIKIFDIKYNLIKNQHPNQFDRIDLQGAE